tara:strand:+ start:530 stop:655 length:126 start_codon:yes stop_codon:yes gene_type:complete
VIKTVVTLTLQFQTLLDIHEDGFVNPMVEDLQLEEVLEQTR